MAGEWQAQDGTRVGHRPAIDCALTNGPPLGDCASAYCFRSADFIVPLTARRVSWLVAGKVALPMSRLG
jgi:hypothetical protein